MTQDIGAQIKILVDAARAQKLVVGGSRGTTGPLGELYACDLLHLERAVEGMRGFDATDTNGSKVQIKSRAPERGEHVNPIGTVGRIVSWDFDYALLVLLDGEFRVDAIWRAEREVLRALQAKVRNPARGMRIHEFTRVARCVHGLGVQPPGVRGKPGGIDLIAPGPPRHARPKGRREAHPIRDTETGKEYRSKYQAGRDLHWLVGGDVTDLHVWFKIARTFPKRFLTKSPEGKWVSLDDPSAPTGTTLPNS